MKFTEGYWVKKEGWTVHHPRELQRIERLDNGFRAFAPTRHLMFKGAELDLVLMTVTVTAVKDGVIKVCLEHHRGGVDRLPRFELNETEEGFAAQVDIDEYEASVRAGGLEASIVGEREYQLSFSWQGKPLTASIMKSAGIAMSPAGSKFMHEQLTLRPHETIYGLGERFGPFVKNGQSADLWNDDGGTATQIAYKNIPFYISSEGYGVFVNHPEKVSYEVGSEINTRVQFSVPENRLEYYIIAGPTPKDVLRRYTGLAGRPPAVPTWSYGLWLSTSFKTDYSLEAINRNLDQMAENGIPLSVFHFDCYWMRPSHWCDFTWDPRQVPDPQAVLASLHDRGLKVCVWINPYIGQQSYMFDEGKERGYLLKRPDGSVRQWDHWQSGMAWVDFTNPQAKEWWKSKLRELLRQGVDAFKTDFGERVPTDVVWHSGADPLKMHNYYSYLYNQAVYEVLCEERGRDEAIVFARAATAGGQCFPVHWGGDSEPTFVSMAESLRGGLSLSMSGFGYWSHDMGGFEGKPNSNVFARWFPFGMFSSHSRLHGSDSYRVPMLYGEDATRAAQRFAPLKNRLVPYILTAQEEVVNDGVAIMRPMVLEFPNDMGSRYVDTQYMFGPSLLVAPVFSDDGSVEFYCPSPGWTNILDGNRVAEAGWHRQVHALDSLPVMAADGTALVMGNRSDAPVYDYDNDPILVLVQPSKTVQTRTVSVAPGSKQAFTVASTSEGVTISARDGSLPWRAVVIDEQEITEVTNGQCHEQDAIPELRCGVAIQPCESGKDVTIRFV